MLLVVLIYFDDHGCCIRWCGMPCPIQHAQGFPDATGRCCWVSVCNVSPGWLLWSSMLPVDRNGLQNTTFSLPLTSKSNRCFLQCEKAWLGWYGQRMFSIQCEDLMMLRFSNTKSSMLYNLLGVGVALCIILDEWLDKTTVQWQSVAWGWSAILH